MVRKYIGIPIVIGASLLVAWIGTTLANNAFLFIVLER